MGTKSGNRELASLVEDVAEQLGMIRTDADQLRDDCTRLRPLLGPPLSSARRKHLQTLIAALAEADAAAGEPLLALLRDLQGDLPEPGTLLGPLLEADDPELAAAGMGLLLGAAAAQELPLDRDLLLKLAGAAAEAGGDAGAPRDQGPLAVLAEALGTDRKARRRLEQQFAAEGDHRIRLLLAAVLDRAGEPAPASVVRAVLPQRARAVLGPYLEYTRASHRDLVALTLGGGVSAALVEGIAAAETSWGKALLRQIVGLLGWERLGGGLHLAHRVEVLVPGYPPVMATEQEADLLTRAGGKRGPERLVAVAWSAAPAENPGPRTDSGASDPVDRFRRLNTNHADLLAVILDVAPLDEAKVRRILAAMDAIVADYAALFAEISGECAILPDVYADLRGRVLVELGRAAGGGPLSAELTRLVQMFEDPANLGQVRTIHGLKRYLHQKGLKYGSRLVDASRAPNRTVDLVLVDRRGRLHRAPPIGFAEFEPAAEIAGDLDLPYPVRLIVEAWMWQLFYGRTTFPEANAFLFGNEVHCYLFFRNHPVFLRLDFSPPQRGGMIDLEYFGVSNYELDVHPNLELEAIRRFFADLDFDASLEGTRLHARYDKERCPDLGDLCRKIRALLRLAPYLMDVDWLIGSLGYGPESRRLVAAAWSRRFAESGVLPLRGLLTADGGGILLGHAPGPTGPIERRWNGNAPYGDPFSGAPVPGLLAALRREMEAAGLTLPAEDPEGDRRGIGLNRLEDEYLGPLRRAGCGRGRSQPRHEAEIFAELIAAEQAATDRSLALAAPVAAISRFLEFERTGSIGALAVEKARLALRGGWLTVQVLRDGHGMLRMALCEVQPLEDWSGGMCPRTGKPDPLRLWALLRGANFVAGEIGPAVSPPPLELESLRELAARESVSCEGALAGAEVTLGGVKAAPGRSVGRAVFGTKGRRPEELAGAVLVAAELGPEDGPFLAVCAGVVCTGGAILSHAALLAIQYGKPAILAAASHSAAGSPVPALHFTSTVQRERQVRVGRFAVGLREVIGRRKVELREGDLVIVDADESSVVVLGQDRDTISLHEGMRSLAEAAARAAAAGGDHDALAARALHLRARHQLGKVLDRLADPVVGAFFLEEVLAAEDLAAVPAADKAQLLDGLLANPTVGPAMRRLLPEVVDRLEVKARAGLVEALERIPEAGLLAEVLTLRLRACRNLGVFAACLQVVVEEKDRQVPSREDLDRVSAVRLADLAAAAQRELAVLESARTLPARARHLLRTRERCAVLSGEGGSAVTEAVAARLERSDLAAVRRRRGALTLTDRACGFALHPLIGWKAANLGEMARLCGRGQCPPWFAVTDQALDLMLGVRVGGRPLREAIAAELADEALDHQRRSVRIQDLWRRAPLPTELTETVAEAYAGLCGPDGEVPVAIRSSSCDEDTETAMRAGEFETYLNITGRGAVLEHLLLTWAGLWSEQALHARGAEAAGQVRPCGGLILQRLVDSRVSGVVQTINVGKGDPGELVINAGLGQGAGIVSGQVTADLITVVKPGRRGGGPLVFNYVTNDKPLQAVRDPRPGGGTRLVETLYHQRLRPALEYIELVELVDRVLALEAAYGYPLDLEFAIEDQTLWLLQARPIACCAGDLTETLNRFPLAGESGVSGAPQPGAKK